MPILNAGLLGQLQGISEGEMPDEFSLDIQGAFVSDGAGGGTYGSPGQRGPYPCRFGQGDATEREIAARMDAEEVLLMTYPLHVNVGEGETGSGTIARTGGTFTFRVDAVLPQGSFSVHRKARIEKVA